MCLFYQKLEFKFCKYPSWWKWTQIDLCRKMYNFHLQTCTESSVHVSLISGQNIRPLVNGLHSGPSETKAWTAWLWLACLTSSLLLVLELAYRLRDEQALMIPTFPYPCKDKEAASKRLKKEFLCFSVVIHFARHFCPWGHTLLNILFVGPVF